MSARYRRPGHIMKNTSSSLHGLICLCVAAWLPLVPVAQARRGQTSAAETGAVRVMTWNVHLFGKSTFGLGGTFADDLRRVEFIIDELAQLAKEGVDVVALQEVWDDDLADELIARAGFPHAASGRDRSLRGDVERTFLGSGLLILSQYPLERIEQVAFAATEGYDSFTSKGILVCDVKLAGRSLGLVATHLHAGGGELTEENRKKQIAVIGAAIDARERKAGGLARPYLIAGDFNTSREVPARHANLLKVLGGEGRSAVDVWQAAQQTEPESGVTAASFNTLRRFFNEGRSSAGHSIDYILMRADGAGEQPFAVRCARVRRFVLGEGETPFGENPEADGSTSPVVDLSDHLAVEVELVSRPVLQVPVAGPLPKRFPESLRRVFTQHASIFGVDVIATRGVPQDKLLHAVHVLAQYLDNDEDGEADDGRVLAALRERGALLVMGSAEEDFEELEYRDLERAGFELSQDLYALETHPAGSSLSGGFDYALEEVWHLVSFGWAETYPEVFAFERGSRLAAAMDLARGGYHRRIPRRYPPEAWYSYYDRTCDYGCQVAEYFYWTLTSKLGAQCYPGRAGEIDEEWRLTTPGELEKGDRAVWSLLDDQSWKLPQVIPDGSYGG